MHTLLIANRGEIAVRIARTAADMGMATIAVYAEDDAAALHTRIADRSVPLPGTGVAAYLDGQALVAAALEAGCDLLHPGYGFLSENAAFARACADHGLVFVGPSAQTLELFGDKARTRELARQAGIPVLPGTDGPTSLEQAQEFFAALGAGAAVMVKAVHGGGGRGTRPVMSPGELAPAYQLAAAEAAAAFGDPALYVEQLLPRARHVEVQIVGDGADVCHVWDRECSLQRERQKVIEIAPAEVLPQPVRERLFAAAVALGRTVGYRGVGTVEFLTDASDGGAPSPAVAFIEVNPRLQVEHTVTEEVTGLDLVRLQLDLARGATLADVGLPGGQAPAARGTAVQARINLETIDADGRPRPAAGTISVYEPPSGPGVRVDGFGYAGYRTSARYDPLLAKLVVHVPGGGVPAAVAKAYRALSEFRIEGVPTNAPFLQSLLAHPSVAAGDVHTRFIEEQAASLLAADPTHPRRYFAGPDPAAGQPVRRGPVVDAADPLAVLAYGKSGGDQEQATIPEKIAADGATLVRAPILGTVVSVAAQVGDAVAEGSQLLVLEAMKLEHVVAAPCGGIVRAITVEPGESIPEGHVVALMEESDVGSGTHAGPERADPEYIRPDLAEVLERRRIARDEARPAVAERHRAGQRSARDNIADLVDTGTFAEYGALTVAARRARNTLPELIAQTPADGLVMGLGQVNGDLFSAERARCAVLSYDYTVLAGTQGSHNHEKLDRMSELALRWRLPVVFFTEGGGGRPGDTEHGGFIRGFEFWGRLSGAVPLVGVTSGRCFAGNAAILGCCDVIIATRNSALGMGGPAMVEGGGLGVFRPEEIGPVEVMNRNGVIDVLVDDEPAAVAAAKKYLSYFQGSVPDWSCADQRLLRHVVPDNRLRSYDAREVVRLLADSGSVLELRPGFGRAMITALLRIEGRPVGLIANNPQHLGGAIDSDAADKAARFLQVCEAFDLPVISLQDTPGNMVGPEAETTGLIRHCSRLFVIGANLTVPILSVVLRKSYGLGAIAMTGGSYQASMFIVSWPTGEFGGMGLEGSVKLGYRKELTAITDPAQRKAEFDAMVAKAYEHGKALARATGTSLDDVIDPAETRTWIARALQSVPPASTRQGKKLRWIDAW